MAALVNEEIEVLGADGYTAEELLGSRKRKSCFAYTYDDVIIMPGYISPSFGEVSLDHNITRNIKVKVPLLSSPMDTVTEHRMAIGMALQGALGNSGNLPRFMCGCYRT